MDEYEEGNEVEIINISANEIANGIGNTLSLNPSFQDKTNSSIAIPIKNVNNTLGTIIIKQDDFDYFHSVGIDLVYKGIERQVFENQPEDAFYKGAVISWKDLSEQKDKSRNIIASLKKRIKEALDKNTLEVLDFIHGAGAGGTTVARRIAYDFSIEYPTIVLNKYEQKKTIEGLRLLINQYTNGSLPLFIILETFEVRDYHQLYSDLGNDHKKAVIFRVTRGNITKVKEKKLTLSSGLELNEIPIFEAGFCSLVPTRKEYITKLPLEFKNESSYLSPMLYALTAYGASYNVTNYVLQSLNEVSTEHKKLIGFISIVYHFTQKSVPAEIFTSLLGGIGRADCDLNKLLRDKPVLDLLHEDWAGDDPLNEWRPRYSILGERTMKILLGGENTQDNWENGLSRYLLDFIKNTGASMPHLNDAVRNILLSLFITRSEDNTGIEDDFTEAIKKLQKEDGTAIFEALTNTYPNEEAFHAHFARYLYSEKVKIQDYDRAIQEAEQSLKLQQNSSLVHTLGMCYRKKAENLKRNYENMGYSVEEAENEMKFLTHKAVDIFEECIGQNPKNTYGYESAIRSILTCLDFAFELHKATNKDDFINSISNEEYLNLYEKAQFLLEDGLSVLEQAKSLEEKDQLQKSASYMYECESRVFKLSGDHQKAKSKYEDLVKNTPSGRQYMRPLYRRMFITHLLYSKLSTPPVGKLLDINQAWGKISQNELKECIDFLEKNLFDDPTNPQNIKWWLQANRHLEKPLSINHCIVEISSWVNNTEQSILSQLEAYYYGYVLNAIKTINKGAFDPASILVVKEMKEKIKHLPIPKNEKFCFEWYGKGDGITQMLNYKRFSDFNAGFIDKHQKLLAETTGSIKLIESPQTGTITLDCGLEAFFVPSHGSFIKGRNDKDRVKFFVGFRYDQIQAWSVTPIDKERSHNNSEKESIQFESIEPTIPHEDSSEITQIEENQSPKADRLPGLKILAKIKLKDDGKKRIK